MSRWRISAGRREPDESTGGMPLLVILSGFGLLLGMLIGYLSYFKRGDVFF